VGSHTYAAPTYPTSTAPPVLPIKVTVVRAFSGDTKGVTITSSAVVQSQVFSGHLDPVSDSGVSNNDGITNINQPTFSGTAQPYSLVQIYSRRPDQLGPIVEGSTVAGGDGSWSFSFGPLLDGWYAISATVTPPGGSPVTSTALPPLVIDTVPPVVEGVLYSPKSSQVEVVFRDSLSGMNLNSIMDFRNYNLIGHPQRRYASGSAPQITSMQIVPSDPQAVVISLNKKHLRMGLRTLRVLSGGVTDVAGNALDGLFRGRFPTGNGLGGTNFVIPLSRAQVGNFPSSPIASRAMPFARIHRRGR
jgi:Bacterial Ig-like domain